MASSTSFTLFLSPSNRSFSSSSTSRSRIFSTRTTATATTLPVRISTFFSSASTTTAKRRKCFTISAAARALEALIFDCDGVILESEHLHRQAYNDAFAHFNVRCPSPDGYSFSDDPLNWSLEFYDVLQNQIGGGKPKMRWFVVIQFLFNYSFSWFLFFLFLLIYS